MTKQDKETKTKMSKDDNLIGFGCFGAIVIFIACMVHNFVYTPYVTMNVYNWYLADFVGRGPMD